MARIAGGELLTDGGINSKSIPMIISVVEAPVEQHFE